MRWIDDRTTIDRDESGGIRSYQGVLIDVTDLRQAELQLRHAQKMDAVGAMASGIAHDFNNVLTVVVGNLGALKRQLAGNAQALSRIDPIEKSARRAIELTRKLLEFSRQDPMPSVHVDINDRIRNMSGLINRSVTPEIRVVYELAGDLWPTEIDPGDFESAVLNLVLNARDAMSGGGQLVIETTNVAAGSSAVKPQGDMVRLTISDDGSGMDAATRERIFEPFFTTKPRGKGTGLGLAMVFGFVKRSKGEIEVTSAQGGGTTFRILFPRAAGAASAQSVVHDVVVPQAASAPPGPTAQAPMPPRAAADASPTILVVDDEPDLRDLVEETLTDHGYRVLTAGDGREAIEVLARGEPVDLLFSDVVMPGGMSGFELARQAIRYRPALKVLLTSGHYEVGGGSTTERVGEVLVKPYTEPELLWRLHALLRPDEPRFPSAN
ncbi:MAG: ATP-binding protein [Gammaproteobacteria bacterium]|nr:ATP-binding protein [Gammaproteobacteria bacterium]